MKAKHVFLTIIIAFFLLATSAGAITINIGAEYIIFFEPNLYKELTIKVYDAQRNANVPIALKGSLAKYANADPSELSLRINEQKEVKVKLQLPEDLPKGIHNLEISATEIPAEAETGTFIIMPAVGATIKVVNTDTDYACGVSMFNTAMSSGSIGITLNAGNNGRKQIDGVYADLKLYDSEGMPVTSWKTDPFSIKPFESTTIESSTDINNAIIPGYYNLKGTLYCGEEKINLERPTLNPATDVKINDFRAFKTNDSLVVQFDLENEFNAPIDVNGKIWFYEGDKHITHYAMGTTTVQPLSKTVLGMTKALEGLRVPPGTFTLKGVLKFVGKEKSYDTTISFTDEELAKKAIKSGFGVTAQEQPKEEAPTQIVLEQPSSEGMSNKMLVRIIAGILILILITIFILKVLAANSKSQ